MRISLFAVFLAIFPVIVAAQDTVQDPLARQRALDLMSSEQVDKACGDRDAWACGELGRRLMFGKGYDKDEALAARYLDFACQGGAPWACFDLGQLSENGLGNVPKDPNLFVSLYMQACDGGVGAACPKAARYLLGSSKAEHNTIGLKSLRTGCFDAAWIDIPSCGLLSSVLAKGDFAGLTQGLPDRSEVVAQGCQDRYAGVEGSRVLCEAAKRECEKGNPRYCGTAFAFLRRQCTERPNLYCDDLAALTNEHRFPREQFLENIRTFHKLCKEKTTTLDCAGFAVGLGKFNEAGDRPQPEDAQRLLSDLCSADVFQACLQLAGMNPVTAIANFKDLCRRDPKGDARNQQAARSACIKVADFYGGWVIDEYKKYAAGGPLPGDDAPDLYRTALEYYRLGCPLVVYKECGRGKELDRVYQLLDIADGRLQAQQQADEYEMKLLTHRDDSIETCAAFLQKSTGAPSVAQLRTTCSGYKLRNFCYSEKGTVTGQRYQSCGNVHCLKDAVEGAYDFADGFDPTYVNVVNACLAGQSETYTRVWW